MKIYLVMSQNFYPSSRKIEKAFRYKESAEFLQKKLELKEKNKEKGFGWSEDCALEF